MKILWFRHFIYKSKSYLVTSVVWIDIPKGNPYNGILLDENRKPITLNFIQNRLQKLPFTENQMISYEIVREFHSERE